MKPGLIRWVLSGIGIAILAALVWFFAPFWHPLAGILARAIIVLIFIVLWLGINLWLDRRRRKRAKAVEEAITAAPADPEAGAKQEELAAISAKLKKALGLLARARGTRGYLYEQPWYAIIGPPGAGKTTALLNAGLKFPLAAELGQGAVAGIGGTRYCDWWFTDEAVLIDTAGRYTTQDSAASVDQAGWLDFLDLLKRTRPHQPLNGVIVAIALADIAGADAPTRLAHARAIRARIKEITTRLGVTVPVYAIFTKADLIAGFTEFFDDLDTAGRSQVWGATFPNQARSAQGAAGGFGAEFKALLARLEDRLLDRLAAERSPDRRALIAGFPIQVASLEAPLAEFLTEAFAGSALDPAPWLRGVYFASGTQEGTPIDRLTGALSRAFGIDQRRAPSLRPQSGRSYFLGRLLSGVIFGEAMLGSADRSLARRRALLRGAGFGVVGLLFALALIALFVSHGNNAAAIARARQGLAAEQKIAAALKLDPVLSADLPSILPLLDRARQLAEAKPTQGYVGYGLDQGADIRAATSAVYRHTLGFALLPRLVLQLEAEMRGGLDRPDYLYQATRVYLMLGNQGPLDAPLVEAWMKLDWQRLYPGLAQADTRAALMANLRTLLARPLPNVPLDGGLIATARATFSRVPIAERVYSRIRDSQAAARVPEWTPAAALGAAGTPLFVNATGKKLTGGIPGFYTVRGFYGVLLPALSHASQDVARESWVLGRSNQIDPNSPQMQSLEHDVISLYETDYAAHWQAMIDDLNLAPLGGAGQSVQALYVLGSPQSPMKTLLASMARQLTLTKPPKPPKGAAKLAARAPHAAAVSAAAQRLKGLLGPTPASAAALPPGSAIDARFAPLRIYVGNGAAGAPISLTLHLIDQVQQQLATLAATAPGAAGPAAPGAGGDPAALLAGEAQHDPEPVRRWLSGITATANALRGGSAAASASAAFKAPGGAAQLCEKAVAGHYPFDPQSSSGTPLADFAHLFAPGGALDTFFNTQVRPFVNMTGGVWRVQAVNGVAPPVSQGAVAEFQRAQEIQQMFFVGSATPSVQFTITPIALSSGAAQVTLQLGRVTITYAHGPTVPTSVTWPGADGMQTARLIITPAAGGTPVTLQASGPWAVFRLFNQGSLTEGGSSARYTLTFDQGGQSAAFTIEAGSIFNPFAPGALTGFRCPSLGG
ncbi:type VI secretion system membrane subunit TssM [Acidiphilium sp. AL]|uniref:Type VI secretion system membrane subunit TssM n=1 Tax=Acidiphilium iwatense TaxID=768198 RepID=A0ABS9E4I9_9PROT|nr:MULTISPECIES: type VI secretion system membrane subunit TssM [Acidiphilium]MCF3948494.1 type VI secretion system membrane subunit TssM [Acidiphilium iwatense]MCU4161239.1 type VI secretion system membrane subunit TssM [Acidiphilium sp. AL]